MKTVFLTFCFFLFATAVHSQSVFKSFERLRQKDLYSARKGFEKKIKRYPAAASMGMAMCYYEPSFRDIDSSLKYLLLAEKAWGLIPTKTIEKLEEIGVDIMFSSELKNQLSDLFYGRCKLMNSADCFNNLLLTQSWNQNYEQIKYYRDSLLYLGAVENRSTAEIQTLIALYPDSPFKAKLDALHDQFEFESSILNGSESEWAAFIEAHPENRYSGPIQDSLFAIFDRNSAYALFIEKYPNNRNVSVAWNNFYTLETNYYHPDSLSVFIDKYPNFPDQERLLSDLDLSKTILYPFVDSLSATIKYGYVDDTGSWRIEPRNWFDEPSFFKQGYAVMGNDGLYGIINKRAELVVPFEYDEISILNNSFLVVSKNGFYGVLNRNGSIRHPLKYSDAFEIDAEHYILYNDDSVEIYNVHSKEQQLKGITDLEVFNTFYYKLWYDVKVGLLKKQITGGKQELSIPTYYDELILFSEKKCIAERKNKLQLLDFNGEVLKDLIYTEVSRISEGYAIAGTKEGKVHYLDVNGKRVLDVEFDYYSGCIQSGLFNRGFAIVKEGNFFGLIDTLGSFKIKPTYEQLIYLNGAYGYRSNGNWSLISLESDSVVNSIFESLDAQDETSILFKQDGKYGVKNVALATVLAPIYRSIKKYNSYYVVLPCEDDLMYIHNVNGELACDQGFEKVQAVNESHLSVSVANKNGYFRLIDGKLILF
ncbi:MAG: WG repeat-containing protein [Crocinitomicaceae bacterium]|nr:WG repeat-containing protein [Crocinitomicaceae bacterium]